MKKKILIFFLVLLLAGGAAAGVWYFKFREGGDTNMENAVFVDSVGTITGLTGASGLIPRFSGVIEPQKTEKVELANGMKVKETYVSVGDEVSVGTKLFSYDTDEAKDSVTQLEIDIENDEISIESSQSQIKTLEKEREKVKDNEKLSYTTQIMTIENSIKRYEYEIKSKQAEMKSLQDQIKNAVVKSTTQGIVKSVNNGDSSGSDSDMSGESNAYITIMATGEYRVKGMVNEQNAQQIWEGAPVIVYSRVDEELTWRGTLATIDKENAVAKQNNYFYGGGDDSMTSSSSYPFYIELDTSDGLMLGQHVYIEMDQGQGEERTGLWLEDYYFITDEDGAVTPYVWAADANDKLEKREVVFGDYDDELMRYEILEGLTVEDYIAYPGEEYEVGMPTTRNIDQLMGSDGDYSEDGDFGGDMMDGEFEEYNEGDMMDADMMGGMSDFADSIQSAMGVEEIIGGADDE